MRRPKGYRIDRRDPRSANYRASDLVGTAPAPPYASLVQHVSRGIYQVGVNSCTGHAIRQAVAIYLRARGKAGSVPSVLATYYQGRARVDGWARVHDGGASALDCWQALRELGIVSEDDWPYVEAEVNTPIPPDCYRDAVGRALSYHWLFSDVGLIQRQIMSALANLYAPTLALPVDLAFENLLGSSIPATPWEFSGENEGWHYVCGVESRPEGLVVYNAWPQWGCNGLWTVGWRTIRERAVDIVLPELL